VLVIALEFVVSAMILVGLLRWLAALAPGGFRARPAPSIIKE
jgi:uncharacterized membrane protein YphA (DoxX/SURF4 family)